jgi:ABC-type Zn uptake system ZnuABC Zn-binding protein ZnuA
MKTRTDTLIAEFTDLYPEWEGDYRGNLMEALEDFSAENARAAEILSEIKALVSDTKDAFDWVAYKELCDKLDEESALPYKYSNFGEAFLDPVFDDEEFEENY